MTDRLSETWEWFKAVYAFDYGDREPLSELIQSEPIPPEYIDAVADIVAGERTPIPRAAVKLKGIPAAKRMQVAASLNFMAGLRDSLLSSPEHTRNVAEAQRIEPIDNVRFLQEEYRQDLEKSAKSYGVSTDTLKNLMREFRKRIARWPVV